MSDARVRTIRITGVIKQSNPNAIAFFNPSEKNRFIIQARAIMAAKKIPGKHTSPVTSRILV